MSETPRVVLAYRAILAEAERLKETKQRGSTAQEPAASRENERGTRTSP